MGAQLHLELVVQGEVSEPDERLAVHEVNNVNAAEVLFDIEQAPAGHAGGVSE